MGSTRRVPEARRLRPTQQEARGERLIGTMSLTMRSVLAVARMLLLVLGAYMLIEFLLPALIAAQAAV